jgi:hypothetical protein
VTETELRVPSLADLNDSYSTIESSPELAPLIHVLSEQLRIMQKGEKRKEAKLKHHFTHEWKCAAIILDRVFFAIFLIGFAITTLALLVPLSSNEPFTET